MNCEPGWTYALSPHFDKIALAVWTTAVILWHPKRLSSGADLAILLACGRAPAGCA